MNGWREGGRRLVTHSKADWLLVTWIGYWLLEPSGCPELQQRLRDHRLVEDDSTVPRAVEQRVAELGAVQLGARDVQPVQTHRRCGHVARRLVDQQVERDVARRPGLLRRQSGLPLPPAPINVRSRVPSSNRAIPETSASRRTKLDSGSGTISAGSRTRRSLDSLGALVRRIAEDSMLRHRRRDPKPFPEQPTRQSPSPEENRCLL